MRDETKNNEHYDDFTAYKAMQNIESQERAKKLVAVLKYIIRNSNFELMENIHLRDKKTGKQYK